MFSRDFSTNYQLIFYYFLLIFLELEIFGLETINMFIQKL